MAKKDSSNIETERKFLVSGDFRPFVSCSLRIVQGYLSDDPGRTVRVRIKGGEAFLTVKGRGSEDGTSRFEWEIPVSVPDARKLLGLCLPGIIDKTRHLIFSGDDIFEVDEFHGDNEGLVLAEIELENPDDSFARPDWLGEEVTGDVRYYNSMLMKNPFRNWK